MITASSARVSGMPLNPVREDRSKLNYVDVVVLSGRRSGSVGWLPLRHIMSILLDQKSEDDTSKDIWDISSSDCRFTSDGIRQPVR